MVCQHWIRNWSNVLLSDFVQVLKRSLLWMHLALALFCPRTKNTGHSNEAINLFMIIFILKQHTIQLDKLNVKVVLLVQQQLFWQKVKVR